MIEAFRRLYGSAEGVRIFRAPGRVNLIGEHTDYNLGFVLPVALELATFVATARAPDGKLRIYSEAREESVGWPVSEIGSLRPARRWTDYPIGVARELIQAGFPIQPQNILIRNTVPEGSGLSSSASMEVSFALALLEGRPIDKAGLARLCQKAEHNFVGIPCGIMDQYVSVFGEAHAAILIDCRSLTHKVVQLPGNIEFLAVNTMLKHELAGSAYVERTRQCREAAEIIRGHYPEVESLRDVSLEMFERAEAWLPPVLARRARHVVGENARVAQFVAACAKNDLEQMGELLEESHRSLQHDYEVSCDELDFLVDAALGVDGVYGARMTGGGFGGCTVNMMRPEVVPHFQEEIARLYKERFALQPAVYSCRPSAGAGEIINLESFSAPGPLG